MWNRALGGNAIAARKPKEMEIHEKLDKCLAACEDNGGNLRGAASWRVWAFDLPGRQGDGAAPKRYISATVGDFAAVYAAQAAADRHVYEIIEARHPVWPYFDLEHARDGPRAATAPSAAAAGGGGVAGLNAAVDGDALTADVARVACEILREHYAAARRSGGGSAQHSGGPVLDLSAAEHHPRWGRLAAAEAGADVATTVEVELLVLDSHRPTKYSRHLILRPHLVCVPSSAAAASSPSERLPLPLASVAAAKVLAKLVCERLGVALNVQKKVPPPNAAAEPTAGGYPAVDNTAADGTAAVATDSFVDMAVYTRNRAFRLVGSSKLGQPGSATAFLSINDGACERLPPRLLSPPLSTRPLAEQLHETLVMPLLNATPLSSAAAAAAVDPDAAAAAAAASRRYWASLDLFDASLTTGSPLRPPLQSASPDGRALCRPGAAGGGAAGGGAAGGAVAGGGAAGGAVAGGATGGAAGGTTGGAAGGAAAFADPPGVATGAGPTPEQWLARIEGITTSPLLDWPPGCGPQHPFIRYRRSGGGGGGARSGVPWPFHRLAEWAVGQFAQWGGGAQGVVGVSKWTYLRSEHPNERLLHLAASGTRFCFAKGRQHKSQNVMLTVDLAGRAGPLAYQRCWDNTDCIEHRAGCSVKSKHALGRPPADMMPSWDELQRFEDANERGIADAGGL